MAFALNEEIITDNPLAHIKGKFKAPSTTHNPSLEPKDLPLLMAAIISDRMAIPTRLLIEWQLHTMVRPNEAAGSRWAEIDLRQPDLDNPQRPHEKSRHMLSNGKNEKITLYHSLPKPWLYLI